MNVIPQIIINSAEHVFVNKQEYQRLQDENMDLITKIRLLTNDYDRLDLIKQNHENTIDVLRNENLLLKERIDILEKENKTLKQEIKDIRCELNDFKQKIKNDNQYNRFLIAIQDMNRECQLEKNIDIKYNKQLRKLRNERNTESHYIIATEDTEHEKRTKIYILGQYLNNMNKEVYDRFNKRYNGLIECLTNHINNMNIQDISKEDIEDMETYWMD